MSTLLILGLILIVGYIGGKLAQLAKLPNVTGYLLGGVLLGPTLFHIVTVQDTIAFTPINDLALSAIAFTIGSEFLIRDMKKLGKAIITITLLEVVGAVFVVFGVMYFGFKQPFALSIVIASMSAATAPAATLMVIKQYRASGPLTKTILPVVALDDVFGIIVFGIALSIAKLVSGDIEGNLTWMFAQPFIEIIGSILLGTILGYALYYFTKRAKNKEDLLVMILIAILLTTGLSFLFNLSSLLACIMLGTMVYNLHRSPMRITAALNDFTPPLYLLFFSLAGASLDLKILLEVGFLGIAYILARAVGKILGAWIGTKKVGAELAVQRNLGLALLPQGGISIGLSVVVRQQLPQYAQLITTAVMFSVLVFETIGPVFAKVAIQNAGEIGGMDKNKK